MATTSMRLVAFVLCRRGHRACGFQGQPGAGLPGETDITGKSLHLCEFQYFPDVRMGVSQRGDRTGGLPDLAGRQYYLCEQFAHYLTHREGEVPGDDNADEKERMDLYAGSYVARLVEVLGEDFPGVWGHGRG